jgi:VanZ family protein
LTPRPLADPPARADPRAARVWLWAPVLAYVTAIFVASSMALPPGLPAAVSDKALHAMAYAVLALLLIRALSGGRWAGVTGRVALASALLATAYGLTDEVHQAFVPGRSADVRDLVADAAGAIVAAAACLAVARARRRRVAR